MHRTYSVKSAVALDYRGEKWTLYIWKYIKTALGEDYKTFRENMNECPHNWGWTMIFILRHKN
jgi:hypothetical protein